MRALAIACVLALALPPRTFAQEPQPPVARDGPDLHGIVTALAGAAAGLALHEGGHVIAGVALGTSPGLTKVSYAGIPFFAITHDPVGPTREFVISSAGFWMQHASSELILTKRPDLRHEQAAFLKGMLAFNVLVSVMYAGAAVARTGPPERDTRGIAVSTGMAEPWVAPVVLAPAVLDSVRYFKPRARAAKWASRIAKAGAVFLIVRSGS